MRGQGRNKLRTYKTFKHAFEAKPFVKKVMNRSHSSALAKLRCDVAPIRLESGRYEHLPEDQRLCPFCNDCVESELHVLLNCDIYSDIRNGLY